MVVGASELAIRARKPLKRRSSNQLSLGLLDMARMGLIYGLLLEGIKTSV